MHKEKTNQEIFLSDLIQAQQNMAPVIKGAVNPHFKSKYADLSSILEIVKPALNNNNLFLFYSTEIIQGIDYLIAKIIHKNGEFIECKLPIKIKNEADKNDPQKYGSAITYAKRYSISALMALAEEDDDGNNSAGRNKQEASYKPNPPVTEEVFRILVQMIADSEDNNKLRRSAEEIKRMKEQYYFNFDQSEKLKQLYSERKKLNDNPELETLMREEI